MPFIIATLILFPALFTNCGYTRCLNHVGTEGLARLLRITPRPRPPHDLLKHHCINFKHGSAGVYRWEFRRQGSRFPLP